jgi:hypothetical protein
MLTLLNGQEVPRKSGAMSLRPVLPGAVIAGLLTLAAVLALLVALGIRGEGPLALDLGDADGAARLDGGGSAALGEPTPGVRESAPVVLPGGGVAAPAAGIPARRRSTGLTGAADGRQNAGSRDGARAPTRRAPVVSPTQPTTTPGTSTRPTATSTPDPNPVKFRGRGESTPKAPIQKQRVTSGGARPSPVELEPVPAPSAPDLSRTAAPTPAPSSTPAGADAPDLTRVPPPSATP